MDIAIELEALQATYETIAIHRTPDVTRISMPVLPFTGGSDGAMFVAACLVAECSSDYPVEAPSLRFVDVKGMSDARLKTLSLRLQHELQQAPGEPVLMTLCLAAQEEVTTLNYPEGATSTMLIRMQLCLFIHFGILATSRT
jgi:RWD domain